MTTMTTNLKSETLMNLPVLEIKSDARPQAKANSTVRQFRIGWIIPISLLVAGIVGFYAYAEYTELTASLNSLSESMQRPQF